MKLFGFLKFFRFFKKINNAILILLIVNISVFSLTLYWLKSNLEANIIKYTIDFYVATSQNISSRIKKYIEYEQFEAMKLVLQQEYYNQDLIFVSVYNSNGVNLAYISRYPRFVDYISRRDMSSFNERNIKFFIDNSLIEIDDKVKISKLLVIFVPIVKTIISDIQDEIYMGHMVIVFDLTKLDNQLRAISFYSNLVIFLLSLLSIVISFFMILQFYRPIEYLKSLSVELSKSKFSFDKKSFWFDEFNYLVDSFLRMAQVLEQQLTLLESIASFDALTKLYNRGAFEKFYSAIAIESKMKIALGLTRTFAVVMIDIDNFKKINDTYGHKIGDKVLASVAEIIKSRKRNTDIAARYGGEEFIIVLNVSTKMDALKFCLDLKDLISKIEIEVDKGNKINVTASLGISFYPDDSNDKDILVKIADDNLYNSKRKGKNRVSLILNERVVEVENVQQMNYLLRETRAELG
ncbi:MAG: GGDEF domain-containing protein [Candidatus Calescibacterium sp.]|nr:GGDEF domain-containing protein [Candidatus Calescibacterium sp.]MDW8133206.1 GGDEF domain-containing protein [Candidatus Calescibacterium sp.]